MPGVASLGVRPTFEPPRELLEAYLFDFDGDLYGRKIEVALHAYIRAGAEVRRRRRAGRQMREDEAAARSLLAHRHPELVTGSILSARRVSAESGCCGRFA